jgi:ethanolamine permease
MNLSQEAAIPMGGSHVETSEYFEKRSLKKGSVSWVLLMTLGVAYVISGDFSGWNYGIAYGGWMGMVVAFAVMGAMYLFMVLGLAEMSSAMPTAGAGYGFARRAMGKTGGALTGFAIMMEYTIACGAISIFVSGYVHSLGLFADIPTVAIIATFFLVFVGIHLIGVGEALKVIFGITAVAVVALVIFAIGMAPHFEVANLFNIAPAEGGSTLFPNGFGGVLAALPFGIWLFLAVEGVPLAAEESTDPKRDMPKGIIGAITALFITGSVVVLLTAGGAGAELAGGSDAPLVDCLNAVGASGLGTIVNCLGLAGLIASFFSIIYSGSRQIFSLSRAGYLPKFLSVTGSRKTPYTALIAMGVIGFAMAAIIQDGSILLNIAVFAACISYAMMNLSHIILHFREPNMERGFKAPGGVVLTAIALVLSLVAIASTFVVDSFAAACALGVLVALMAYFGLYSSRHLVSNAPEEEFEALKTAESALR